MTGVTGSLLSAVCSDSLLKGSMPCSLSDCFFSSCASKAMPDPLLFEESSFPDAVDFTEVISCDFFETGYIVITQLTAPPVSNNRKANPNPVLLRRVCKALFTPLQTFSEGNIRYSSAFCCTNCSKSLLL